MFVIYQLLGTLLNKTLFFLAGSCSAHIGDQIPVWPEVLLLLPRKLQVEVHAGLPGHDPD